MKERDDTFIKMAGRRVIPYLRFQRLLIGLYTVMMVFGGVLFVVAKRFAESWTSRFAIVLAAGIIAGESLAGVGDAVWKVISGLAGG